MVFFSFLQDLGLQRIYQVIAGLSMCLGCSYNGLSLTLLGQVLVMLPQFVMITLLGCHNSCFIVTVRELALRSCHALGLLIKLPQFVMITQMDLPQWVPFLGCCHGSGIWVSSSVLPQFVNLSFNQSVFCSNQYGVTAKFFYYHSLPLLAAHLMGIPYQLHTIPRFPTSFLTYV